MLMNNFRKSTRIIGLYFAGFLFLAIYFYIDSSAELGDFLRKADRVKKDAGFGFTLVIGFFKLVSLAAGIAFRYSLRYRYFGAGRVEEIAGLFVLFTRA